MTFVEFERQIHDKALVGRIGSLLKSKQCISLSGVEKKRLFQKIEEHLKKANVAAATNYLLLGIYQYKEDVLKRIRSGLLRGSRYLPNRYIGGDVLEILLSFSDDLGLKEEEVAYLNNIKSMAILYKFLLHIHTDIYTDLKVYCQRLAGRKWSLIRTLLVYIDFLFYKKYDKDFDEDISVERSAEGASFLIHLIYDKEIDLTGNGFVDVEYIKLGKISELINLACLYKDIQSIEIGIERFGYRISAINNLYNVQPPSVLFQKTLNLGYIRTDLQRHYLLLEMTDKVRKGSSLNDVVDWFVSYLEKKGIEILEYTEDHDCPRFRMRFIAPFLEALKKNIFHDNMLFAEEFVYLSEICKEQIITVEDLKKVRISENLSVYDLLMFKRVFSFGWGVFIKKVAKHEKKSLSNILNSLVVTGDVEWLKSLLIPFATNPEAVNEYIDAISYNIESREIYDIQYSPILKFNSAYHIPLATLVASNSIRNVYSLQHKGGNKDFLKDGQDDKMAEILCTVFKEKYFDIKTKIKYSFEGMNGEIDFLAIKDGYVLIVECKETLHPTSTFELRTYFDYLQKAGLQLNQINSFCSKDKFREQLCQRIGVDITGFKTLQTLIVTNSRIFQWCPDFGHPIRTIFELSNFLDKGEGLTQDGNFNLWKSDNFSLEDLICFLGENFNPSKIMLDSMEEVVSSLAEVKGSVIQKSEYMLNQEKCREALQKLIASQK